MPEPFMPEVFMPEVFMPELRLACCDRGSGGTARRPAPAQKPIRSKSRLLKPNEILQMILTSDLTGEISPDALLVMISWHEPGSV
jgi:hypothetical protein